VYNSNGECSGLLSQSVIFYSISPHIGLFHLANHTLKNLQLGFNKSSIFSIQKTDSLLEAFKLIASNRCSGVAVLDGNVLVGNVSASDIKMIGTNPTNLACLDEPVSDAMVRKRPIVVYPNSTVLETVELITKERIHRIYVVDKQTSVLEGVISLVDILKLICMYLS